MVEMLWKARTKLNLKCQDRASDDFIEDESEDIS